MRNRPGDQEIDAEQLKRLQEHYQMAVLPRIERHAAVYFRHYRRNPEMMEELTQQAVANGWKSHLNICRSGRDPSGYLSTIAVFACRGVKSGRRIQGQEKSMSVSNPLLQNQEGVRVESLPTSMATSFERLYDTPGGQRLHDELEVRLRDNTVTPPSDQAAFRIDYPVWLSQLGSPKREIAEDMAAGETTQAIADKHNKSPGRISQMRRELHRDWQQFHGEKKER